MKKLILHIAFIGSLASLFSCELMVDVDVPAERPRIVVNAFLTPDSIVRISVTKSRHILDTLYYFEPIGTAAVRLSDETGSEIPITHMTGEWFKSDVKPQGGKNYKLRVESDGFMPVTTSMTIPEPVEILDAKVDSSESQSSVPKVQVEITFLDPGDTKNYYEAGVYQKIARQYTNHWTQEIIYDTITMFYPLRSKTEGEESRGLFSDLLFNGKVHTLKGEIDNYYGFGGSGTVMESKIILKNLSQEYYNYITTMRLQWNTEGDPFAQPVLVYSNIQNGFGIFAGYSQSAIDLLE